ncbi:hypothetical protein E3N88_34309 [Mikania micrantha]|uniref:Nitrite/Sulfite reductase ferredoxin-like domain-containing protein n=1 Tax=Mikania micrantha TaxID=192012 RepID=A0A5N6LXR7_9ASTR|nr:hypothetical protein E3N88_34309 [Mikania micrantha]
MSAFHVKFPVPNSFLNPMTAMSSTRLYATTVPAPVPAPEMTADRLEPRVEKKDGYYVVKEKFRAGINPQEKVKIGGEPMKLFMENGIEDLAKIPFEELDKSKDYKDDVDVRLKWLGLFHRRKHQYGRFMMRLKLPNGITTSAQTRFLASVIKQYGEHGCADITTRQNWQIRVGNPLAGIDPHEIVDTRRPYLNLLSQFITSNSRGNPEFTNLGNRQKTRMMWLIDELGVEGFRSEVVKRMPNQALERSSNEDLIDHKWERRDYFARLADEYGSGELRLTVEQNIIIPNVQNSKVEALLEESLLKEKFLPEPPILMKG